MAKMHVTLLAPSILLQANYLMESITATDMAQCYLQAGHFGQAPFDPLDQTNDYNRQAEVSHFSTSLTLAQT